MTLRINPAVSSVKLGSLQKGLVLDMSLDQESYNPATKRFTDKTPYSNHGTSYNAATFTTDQMGQPNRAMSFNGTDDYVDCGNDGSLNFGTLVDFTLEAWIKVNGFNTSSWSRIVSKTADDATSRYSIAVGDLSDKTLKLQIGGDVVSSRTLAIRNYYHVAGVRSGSTGIIYINGTQENTGTITTDAVGGAKDLLIGIKEGGDDVFNGAIPKVRIYNYAKSPDEISLLSVMYRPKFLI